MKQPKGTLACVVLMDNYRNQHSATEPTQMSGNLSISDVRHACLTYSIDEITDFRIDEEIAIFKGTYYHPSHRGETWLFLAYHRKGGGIGIVPICDASGQGANISDSSADSDQEASYSPNVKYDEETLGYLVEACQYLARLQKNLRWHPEFLEEEKKVLDICSAISRKIDRQLNETQKDKMNYMFYG